MYFGIIFFCWASWMFLEWFRVMEGLGILRGDTKRAFNLVDQRIRRLQYRIDELEKKYPDRMKRMDAEPLEEDPCSSEVADDVKSD